MTETLRQPFSMYLHCGWMPKPRKMEIVRTGKGILTDEAGNRIKQDSVVEELHDAVFLSDDGDTVRLRCDDGSIAVLPVVSRETRWSL